MAASPSPGSRSPLRMAGIALLGVGVVAAFAGLISTTQGDGNGTVAQAPTSSAEVLEPSAEAALPTAPPVESAPPAATPAPEATPFVPGSTADGSTGEGVAPAPPASAPVAVPAQTPAIAAPAPAAAGDAAGQQPVVREPLRVYNNSLVPGLAARAAENFRSSGWTVSEVGGYKGRLLESAAYYRPGTNEEAAARQLAADFGLVAKPRFAEIQGAQSGVIVILIKDYAAPGKS